MWSVFNTLSSLKTFLCGFGVWTPLAFLILQIVQVVVAPIPGGPLTMLGGMLFGLLLILYWRKHPFSRF